MRVACPGGRSDGSRTWPRGDGDREARRSLRSPEAARRRTSISSRTGQLSLATDNPAFPPWWGGAAKKPWEVSNPASGKGYESAVAYAVARQLGFAKGQVTWSAVPFNNSFRPGNKPFDFYMAQVSFAPERARNVSFSNSYYFVNQAVVANAGTPISRVRTVAGLRPVQARRPGRARRATATSRGSSGRRRARPCTTRTTTRSRR